MPMPELPIRVPKDHVQVDGERTEAEVFQTHRGKKRDNAGPLTSLAYPSGLGEYPEGDDA